MHLSAVPGNPQKLDGGAMFGNVPKALWSRWVTVDSANRIDLACRAMLLETQHHRVLFEAGIGVFMPPKLKQRFGVETSQHVLLDSLFHLGLSHEDITDIVISHLHFDHVGGLLAPWEDGASAALLFPNARFHVGRGALERARQPHVRDRASFIPELPGLLDASGRLRLMDVDTTLEFDACRVDFFESHGHTPSMMCARLTGPAGQIVFAGDLIPGIAWIHLPVTMGYDRYPEALIDEKRELLHRVTASGASLFFTHDPRFAMAGVAFDEDRNRYAAVDPTADFSRIDVLG